MQKNSLFVNIGIFAAPIEKMSRTKEPETVFRLFAPSALQRLEELLTEFQGGYSSSRTARFKLGKKVGNLPIVKLAVRLADNLDTWPNSDYIRYTI